MSLPTSRTNQKVKDAIRRENTVTSQPYCRRDRIATGADKAKWKLRSDKASHRDFLASSIRNKIKGIGPGIKFALDALKNGPEGPAVLAFIVHGRWMAQCNTIRGDDTPCSGIEVVDPNDPVFMCLSCFNLFNEGKLVPVDFPKKQDRIDIEELLVARPLIITRGWLPQKGETLSTLIMENKTHGIVVPDRLWPSTGGGD